MRWKLPTYRLHKGSGRAVIQFRPLYGPRPKYLDGPFGSDESRKHFARCLDEIGAWMRRQASPAAGVPLVATVAAAYLRHAEEYYKGNDEFVGCRCALDPLVDDSLPWWSLDADKFDALALEAIRDRFVALGLSRGYINQQINRIRRAFRWAAKSKMVPAAVVTELELLDGLRRGKSRAQERERVRPVERRWIKATLPFLQPHIRAMATLQWLTGMRSSEVTRLAGQFITRVKGVWIFEPPTHKTAHHGKRKLICLGPKAQKILAPWVCESGFFFRPSLSQFAAGDLAERYDHRTYRRAIFYGLRKAARQGVLLPPWNPHRIRHSRATITRAEYGIEGAQAQLGNALEATEIYAEKSLKLALKIARETG